MGTYSPGHGRTVDETWPTDGVASSTYSVDKAAAERLRALGWSPRRDAREVLGTFVDAMGQGAGQPGPVLYPARHR